MFFSKKLNFSLKRGITVDIRVGDVLTMKKAHPCGEKRWLVLRTGMDFKLRCMGCGHEVMGPRNKFERNIRSVERKETGEDKELT